MSEEQTLRPRIHYSPRKNWMNDPNGCVYHQGTYHLFYQYNPLSSSWGNIHWGHAVSTDLLSWREQEPALYPDEQLGKVFSGTIVEDKENESGFFPGGSGLIAFFTSNKELPGGLAALQQQCLAYSTDGGTTWTNYTENPVIKNPGITNFRDPKVFHHKESSAWIMLVATGPEIWIYRSMDLKNWDYSSTITSQGWTLEDVLECPDLFPILCEEGLLHWVLTVSHFLVNIIPGFSPVKYMTGKFDGYRFIPQGDAELFDFGGDFYAPQSWNEYPYAPDKQVWIAWANNWNYANHIPTYPWRGVMTLPRELRLCREKDQLILLQKPVPGLETLISEERSFDKDSSGKFHIDLHPREAQSILIEAKQPDSGSLQIAFFYTKEEELIINWDGELSTMTIDKKHLDSSCFHKAYPQRLKAVIPQRKLLNLEIIIDISIIEIFINQGERVFTCQIFPQSSIRSCECSGGGSLSLDKIKHRIFHAIYKT